MSYFSTPLRKTLSLGLALLLSLGLSGIAQAQLSYRQGQHIEPAYEGWWENDDGTLSFIFGYFNENWEEELDVPIGENNFFSGGEQDRGQPTHFLPRRNRFTFEVKVPETFDEWGDRELVWTITSGKNNVTKSAYGTLRPDYKVDNIIIASETGSLGAGTSSPEIRANVAPVARVIGDTRRTVRVGEPLLVRTEVTDDGIPKPRRFGASLSRGGESDEEVDPRAQARSRLLRAPSQVTVGKTNGLFLSWNVYRGEGSVSFDPPQIKPWEDTRTSANSPWGALWTPPEVPEDGMYEVNITFDEPGEYLLWGRADDGALYHDQYITVTVEP